MPSIHTMLLPTDFSDAAEQAATLAIAMAQAFGAKLLLLCVYAGPIYMGPFNEAYATSADILERLRRETERALEGLRQRASDAGVSAESFALPGRASDVIVEMAQSHAVDLIVMGTHGRTGFRHLLLGSVAEHVIRTAACPVLTVPAKHRGS